MSRKIKNKITKASLLIVLGIAIYSCSTPIRQKNEEASGTASTENAAPAEVSTESKDAKGIGKFTKVELSPTLDVKMATIGKEVYDVKCASCHRLNDEKLVGPGWKDVTQRRTAEWVMNFSTNPDEMLDKDAIAKGMLEECLVRMPNQSLTDDDARSVYEYMRENDGVK
ncbi:MAG: cytochrome c [Bacteroidetes bacterium]|nr:cytochrome c [Bacteroidota bacterium]